MRVLKATIAERDEILNNNKGNNRVSFIKDRDGNYVTSVRVLSDIKLKHLYHLLSELEEIDYSPIITDE